MSTLHLTTCAECRSREENLGLLDSSLGVMKVESRASGTAAVLTGTLTTLLFTVSQKLEYKGPWVLVLWPGFQITGHASPAAPS